MLTLVIYQNVHKCWSTCMSWDPYPAWERCPRHTCGSCHKPPFNQTFILQNNAKQCKTMQNNATECIAVHNTLYPTSPDDPSSMFPGWAVKVSQMLFPLPPSLAPPSTFHFCFCESWTESRIFVGRRWKYGRYFFLSFLLVPPWTFNLNSESESLIAEN